MCHIWCSEKWGLFTCASELTGGAYRRSLETDVFSVARERIPKKVQEILDEITAAAKTVATPKPDAPPSVVP